MGPAVRKWCTVAALLAGVVLTGCAAPSSPVAATVSSIAKTGSTTTRPSTTSTRPPINVTAPDGIPKPDPRLSPGATFPVTAAQVCVAGYSSSVRSVSTAEKDAVFAEYGIPSHAPDSYEIDHLISLELGGSNDIRNLWPEPYAGTGGAHAKDAIENELHAEVCSGRISLTLAQAEIVRWWVLPGALQSPPALVPETSPSPTSPATALGAFVHPGAFCSPLNAIGHTSARTKMICSDHSATGVPYKGGTLHWRAD